MAKVFSFPHRSRLPWTAQSILELAPGPIAVWSADRSNCILNDAARQMTGFTERDFREARTLWIGRIQPQDQGSFLAFWNELEKTEKKLTFDYRFLPKGRRKEITLRDSSVSLRSPDGAIDNILSTYTDISDLKTELSLDRSTGRADQPLDLVKPLLHEVQNNLHVIRMGVDLVAMDPTRSIGLQSVTRGIKSLDNLCHELHEYCFPWQSQPDHTPVDYKEILNKVQIELHHQGISCRIVEPCASPVIKIHVADFLQAFKHIAQFCQVLLPPCGELEAEAGYDPAAGRVYLTLTIDKPSCDLDESRVFHPFLRIHGRNIGLGMAVALQILRREGGDLMLQKESKHRLVLTISLKA